MYTPKIRITIVILNILIAIFFFVKGHTWFPLFALFTAFLFLHGYFKAGTVYIAFQQLKKGNVEKAEELLLQTKKPEKLSKGQKAYYHFTKGFINIEKERFDIAYSELEKALEIGLKTKNDTSIVLLNLAGIEYERKNYKESRELLNRCKEFELKPLIESNLKELEEKLKQYNF